MNHYYPPVGFNFEVIFQNPSQATGASKAGSGMSFQSVSGLNAEVVTEAYSEGGNNDFDHILPVKTQYPSLVLKRGLWIPDNPKADESEIQAWFHDMMQHRRVHPKNLIINLLNPSGGKTKIRMSWAVKRAWPLKWSISDFDAQNSQVVIETMELHYDSFNIAKP